VQSHISPWLLLHVADVPQRKAGDHSHKILWLNFLESDRNTNICLIVNRHPESATKTCWRATTTRWTGWRAPTSCLRWRWWSTCLSPCWTASSGGRSNGRRANPSRYVTEECVWLLTASPEQCALIANYIVVTFVRIVCSLWIIIIVIIYSYYHLNVSFWHFEMISSLIVTFIFFPATKKTKKRRKNEKCVSWTISS